MLSGDVESRWTGGAISQEHARRLWSLLPHAVQALLRDGPSLIDTLVPGAPLLARAAAAMPGQTDHLERLQAIIDQRNAEPDNLEQSNLLGQVTNVLHTLGNANPLLLLLDDMQWADPASMALLFQLGRHLRAERSCILLVSAYRPSEVALGRDGERHPLDKILAEFKRYYGDIWLDLTQANEMGGRAFVDAFLDTAPNRLDEAFREALFRRTGGHPLLTVELLRALQERADLTRNGKGDGWQGRPWTGRCFLPAWRG